LLIDMAGHAFALSDHFLPQRQVGALEYLGALGFGVSHGESAAEQEHAGDRDAHVLAAVDVWMRV
jgi:hypothetical protein